MRIIEKGKDGRARCAEETKMTMAVALIESEQQQQERRVRRTIESDRLQNENCG